MHKRALSFIVIVSLCFGIFASSEVVFITNNSEVFAAQKTFTVTPKSKSKKYKNSKKYKKKTKIYFALRERLEKLEKSKGGTLIFKRGTYVLTNTLYIPSNVNLVFEDGVVIKRGNKTGVKSMKASTSLFQLIKPSKSKKKKVYGKYNGSKNITFEGRGNVVIDLRYYKKNHAIMAAHNQNVTIRNITFKNSNVGHFIELNSNLNTRIEGCKFMNSKGDALKEAINIDTPDKKTGGWNQKWSKFDKTPCQNVYINNCTFINMGHAVGTHKYSYGHPHSNIQITNCNISGTRGEEAIRMQNWVYPVVSNNNISGGRLQAIIGRGTTYPTITGNTISGCRDYAIRVRNGWNIGSGKSYPMIYSYMTDANIEAVKKNTVTSGAREVYLQLNPGLNKYSSFIK